MRASLLLIALSFATGTTMAQTAKINDKVNASPATQQSTPTELQAEVTRALNLIKAQPATQKSEPVKKTVTNAADVQKAKEPVL